jgi:hypothetical protein
MAVGVSHGQQRVHLFAQETEQDTKATKLRTGVAVCPALCGAADVFPGLQDTGEQETQKTVLGYKKMFC